MGKRTGSGDRAGLPFLKSPLALLPLRDPEPLGAQATLHVYIVFLSSSKFLPQWTLNECLWDLGSSGSTSHSRIETDYACRFHKPLPGEARCDPAV